MVKTNSTFSYLFLWFCGKSGLYLKVDDVGEMGVRYLVEMQFFAISC